MDTKNNNKNTCYGQIQVAIIFMANCIKYSEDNAQFDELLSTSKELKNG